MSTLLVIGGSGFFGKSILDAYWRDLLEPWGIRKIIIMARNATTTLKNYPELIYPPNANPESAAFNRVVELLDADICTCSSLPFADYVIHAAASTDTRDYLIDSEFEKKNIINGTTHFCGLAKSFLRNSKILYVSSGAVYGQQPSSIDFIKESFAMQEVTSLVSNKRAYASAKRSSELEVAKLAHDGLQVMVARCFSFVGAYLPLNQHFAVGNFLQDGLNGRPINIKAKHLVYRSYLYADDLVNWLFILLESASTLCPIVNLGSDQIIELNDLGKLIANIFGVGTISGLEDFNNVDRYIPSVNRAMEMGCKRRVDLEDALVLTIDGLKLKKIKW